MKSYILEEIIVENPKSTLKVNQSKKKGEYIFFTSGIKTKFYNNFLCKGKNIFIATGGKANISFYEGKAAYSTDCYSITTKPFVDTKFLYYVLKTKIIEIDRDMFKGAALKHLQKKQFKNIKIKVPNIIEQQRIVAKLDVAFAQIDNIIKFEQTKLKKNEILIQNFVDKIFKDNKNLHKLCDCTQIKPPKSEVNDLDNATEVSFLPMKDMQINNKLAIPNQKRKLKDVKGSYTYFSEGDILLAKITPCFENGKMGIASNLLNGIGFGSSEYIVFRPNKNLKNDWLYYFLNRNSFRISGAQNMSGAVGHKRVDKDFIGNTLIPIPSLEEQEKIISNLESLFNHSKAINKIILKKIDEINHLKKAILNKLLINKLVDAA